MEWISVEDRLPEECQSVVLVNIHRWENTAGDWGRNVLDVGYLNRWGGKLMEPHWSIRGERAQTIKAYTHWMPLPDSPTREEKVVINEYGFPCNNVECNLTILNNGEETTE